MKRTIRDSLLGLCLVMYSLNNHAADFHKGYECYQAQDYACALKEWWPLAEQGDADAQSNRKRR